MTVSTFKLLSVQLSAYFRSRMPAFGKILSNNADRKIMNSSSKVKIVEMEFDTDKFIKLTHQILHFFTQFNIAPDYLFLFGFLDSLLG